ncbi:hypothetical protein NGB36_05720 [Streptomyces sp. RB6PN25]|uniref:Secreted protein n=1 Tax=Streptomyces humicola TaxID=2953240 RepID=A0ABT1PR06_9ACTN|nr:hypothetical protein [Streptomyces humicola]MCQ4080102.1 hypothetical protein [Streptomyces humicola]
MRRLAAVTITALAASLSTTTQAEAAGPPVVPVNGSTDFCLTPDAVEHMSDSGITMHATGEATLERAKPNCVKFPVTVSSLSFNGAELGGGVVFQRGPRRVEFSHLYNHFAGRYVTADASVNGGPTTTIPFLSYQTEPRDVADAPSVDYGSGLMRLTPSGEHAFTEAFGQSPVNSGQNLYSSAGRVDVLSTATGAMGQLLPH